MHITNILLIIVAGLNLGLSSAVFFRNPKDKINQSFTLSLLLVAGWSFLWPCLESKPLKAAL